jgi:hypothetical protein
MNTFYCLTFDKGNYMQKITLCVILSCIALILAAGCASSTNTPLTTTTPAILAPTTAQAASIVEQARANAAANNKQVSAELQAVIDNIDPIVGAWGYKVPVEGGFSLRQSFQSDGKIKNGVGDGYSGTWIKNGPGVYTFTEAFGSQEVAVYDSVADTLSIETSSGVQVWKRVPDY